MNWNTFLTLLLLSLTCSSSTFLTNPVSAASKAKGLDNFSDSTAMAQFRVGCITTADRPRSQKVDPDPDLDGERFVRVLRQKLPLERHMGYVVIVQNYDLRNVATDTSGFAISNCDPGGPQPFTVDTRTAWGSVSKLITTAVVASLAEDSNQLNLGDRFASHVPNRWQVHRQFENVTFAQLLGHRAGLRRSSGVPLRERLANRFPDDPPVGDRSYSNTGHGIAGRMAMRAVLSIQVQNWEQQHAHDRQQAYDDAFIEWSSDYYIRFTNQKV